MPAETANVLRDKVDGQTNPPPVVFNFTPATGEVGTNVIIIGTNFDSATAVTFNGVNAAFTVNSNSEITAVVPLNGSSGFISVTTPSGTSISSNDFVVTGLTTYIGTLIGWDMSSLPGGAGNYGPSLLPPTTNAPNLTVIGLTRGSGVVTNNTTAASGAWGGLNFTNVTDDLAVSANKFVTFSLSANTGYKLLFTSVNQFDYRRSSTGPSSGVLQFQIGSGAFTDITNLSYPVSSSGGASIGTIDLSGITALQNVGANTNVTFRIVNYGGTSSAGNWFIYDKAGTAALDFALQGIVAQIALPITNAPAAAPSFSGISFENNQFQFTLNGTPGSNYVVQVSTNLTATNWISIQTNVAPFSFVESNANLFPARFYRGKIAP
ncbi:MAG: hypothetical protein WDM76_07945 [Limisphaerales bacterium]